MTTRRSLPGHTPRRILVAGATSAIATACCRIWASRGAQFCLLARSREHLDQVRDDLRVRGAAAVESLIVDLADIGLHAEALDNAFSALGGIDIVLVAYGTLPDQNACERTPEIMVASIHTNATSVMALLTRIANRMQVQRSGTIAVISSVAGDRGRRSNYVYGSAKAMLSTFCEGLRARMCRAGVRVLVVKPGFVATPMTRGIELPAVLTATAERVAADIVEAIDRGKELIYTPSYWRVIMAGIRAVPNGLFKRLPL